MLSFRRAGRRTDAPSSRRRDEGADRRSRVRLDGRSRACQGRPTCGRAHSGRDAAGRDRAAQAQDRPAAAARIRRPPHRRAGERDLGVTASGCQWDAAHEHPDDAPATTAAVQGVVERPRGRAAHGIAFERPGRRVRVGRADGERLDRRTARDARRTERQWPRRRATHEASDGAAAATPTCEADRATTDSGRRAQQAAHTAGAGDPRHHAPGPATAACGGRQLRGADRNRAADGAGRRVRSRGDAPRAGQAADRPLAVDDQARCGQRPARDRRSTADRGQGDPARGAADRERRARPRRSDQHRSADGALRARRSDVASAAATPTVSVHAAGRRPHGRAARCARSRRCAASAASSATCATCSTALFGVRRARRELGELETKQRAAAAVAPAPPGHARPHRGDQRRRSIIPALGQAREPLGSVEEERARARRRGRRCGCRARPRQSRSRDQREAVRRAIVAAVDAELAELAKKLEPLEKEAASATKKRAPSCASRCAGSTARSPTPRRCSSRSRAAKMDPGGDPRRASRRSRPTASRRAARRARDRRRARRAQSADRGDRGARAAKPQKRSASSSDGEDERPAPHRGAARGDRREAQGRRSRRGDAETARDKMLFELGERLYVDRPETLARAARADRRRSTSSSATAIAG